MENTSTGRATSSRCRSKRLKTVVIRTPTVTKTRGVYDRPHKCMFVGCKKAYTRLEHLQRHQLKHKSVRTWACSICPSSFVRKDLWKRHMSVSHDAGPDPSPTQPRGSSRSPFAERHCNYSSVENDEDGSPNGNISGTLGYNQANTSQGLPDLPTSGLTLTSGQDNLEGQIYDFNDPMHTYSDPLWSLEDQDETGLEWFLNNQCPVGLAGTSDLAAHDVLSSMTYSPPSENTHITEIDNPTVRMNSIRRRPIFLQEQRSKPFIAETGRFEPPNCGFRICNALTEDKRAHLLAELYGILNNDIAIDEQIFSLDSMRHGIHLYFGHINIEYTFLHHEFLIPSSEWSRQARLVVCGSDSEPGAFLFWAIISTGWSLMRSRGNREYVVAGKIQRALRISMMSHPGLACSPPLWLVQAMFVVLLFARYRGDREDYGFASIFHGVLLEATRRLDNSSHSAIEDGIPPNRVSSAMKAWIKWVSTESIQRIVRYAFILDVEHAVLYGGKPSMMPFDLNIRLSASVDAWYATSPQEWERTLLCPLEMRKSVSFLEMLKMLWNPQITTSVASSEILPRGSNIALYGLVSIALELRRRKEVGFLDRHAGAGAGTSLASLGDTVIHSLRNWEPLWARVAVPHGLTANFLWRDCSCMIHLAYTVYEVDAIDLQTVSGKTVIEGKRRSAEDYVRSRRKMGRWVKEDRAWLGLARAAIIIKDRIYNTTPDVVHCHHCLWCLYLATLVCWTFGFALTGNSSSEHLVKDTQVTSLEEAEVECLRYLQVATSLPARFQKEHQIRYALGRTTGLVVVLIRFLRDQCQTGMIMESIEVLARLVGVRDWVRM
ncbi:hypothetical protein K505DRAFT_325596 [Melanomma pulvis-pyrius CBS 109.77]|uniref:C2H2-type domain-containing protein n=1 Tax=Melanomma pulvis-pyrius CBS 109.77 TaxID=1314802 RepID=A0A6A6XAF2_9PLEO|nr:hypothetical protein K505DRAFT_325596 [Melanomma pulvis-pyrius CBS 109.77]